MPSQIAPPRPKSSPRTTTTTTIPAPAPPTPIWTRKRDLLYLMFFLIHIPTVLFVDLYAIYPAPLRLQFMTDLRTYYISTYRDQFSISPPAWFTAYMWMEALYHLPVSIWAVRNLVIGAHPLLPLHLLLFAAQTGITTLTCVADMMSWTGTSWAEKRALGWLYGPYLALCTWGKAVFMGLDCYGRVRARLVGG